MQARDPQLITAADLRARGRELGYALRQNARWMVALCTGVALAAGAVAYLAERSYEATLRFVVAEDAQGQLAGIGSVLGQFGFGGAGIGQSVNLNKVVELASAEIILERVLYHPVDSTSPLAVNAARPLIRTVLVDSLDLREDIDEKLERLRQSTPLTPAVEREAEDLFLIELLGGGTDGATGGGLGGGGMIRSQFDSESGIVSLAVESADGDVSLAVMRALYDELDRYYVDQQTAQERRSLFILNAKLDSIRGVIRDSDARIAAIRDREQAVLLNSRSTELTVLSREQSINTLIYGELLKNKSATEFILATKTPSFELVSASRYPLEPAGRGVAVVALIAGVVAGIACALYLLVTVAFAA